MSVRAKFKVDSITQTKHWDKSKGNIHSIKLTPVGNNSPENASFYAATPSGEINLQTLNADAGAQFVLGDEYYIDFTPANG